MKESQRVYSPKELATILDINPSTLRKYADILEKKNYKFHKNDLGHRGYFDHDAIAFRKLIDYSRQEDMTLESAAIAVVAWYSSSESAIAATVETEETHTKDRYEDTIAFLKEFATQQMKFNQELLNRLDEQNRYIEQSIKARDTALLESIREIQADKLAITTASQSFFTRFINRLFKKHS